MTRTEPSIESSVHDLAERQHGVIARHQADRLGLPRAAWRRRMRGVDWELLTPRVARRRGSVDDAAQRAHAGVLDAGPGAYLSHASGVAWWGPPGYDLEPVHVVNARRVVRTSLATVHLPRHLPDPFATELRGMPVVRPALLLLEMAPRVSSDRLLRLLDWFWTRRLLTGPSTLAELDDVMHRGRPGTVALRDLIEGLPDDYVPPASGIEGRFARIAAENDLPRLRRQVDLGDADDWCGRVDFLAEDLPLIVEVQSDAYHAALSSREDDRRRRERLESAGFVVAEVWEEQLWFRAREVVDEVRRRAWEARALQANQRTKSDAPELLGTGARSRS